MTKHFLKRSRHDTVYYFRRVIPKDLKTVFGASTITRSTNTTNKRQAVILGRSMASQTDKLFSDVRLMKKKTNSPNEGSGFGYEIGFDANGNLWAKTCPEDTEEDRKQLFDFLSSHISAKEHTRQILTPATKQETANGAEHLFTFRNAIESYEANYLNALSNASRKRYQGHLKLIRKLVIDGQESPLSSFNQTAYIRLITEYANEGKAKTLTSIKAFAGFVKLVISRSEEAGHLVAPLTIPSNHIATLRHTECRGPRRAYTKEEIEYLLNLLHDRHTKNYRNHRQQGEKYLQGFWAFYMAFITGARIEELSQLDLKNDLVTTEFKHPNGQTIYAIIITETDDEDGSSSKSLKTSASQRTVPLPYQATEVGLTSYLIQKSKTKDRRPFPDHPKQGIKWSHKLVSWLGKIVSELKVDKPNGLFSTNGCTIGPFHSARHAWATSMRTAGVTYEHRSAFQGHISDQSDEPKQNAQSIYAAGTLKECVIGVLPKLEEHIKTVKVPIFEK